MNPHSLLARWLNLAVDRGVGKAKSFCLGTANSDGELTSRMLLSAFITPEGLIFCTDARSPKLSAWPRDTRASALFYWHPIHRQVRIAGTLEHAAEQYADADFAAKSRSQQLAIIVLEQSAPIRRYAEIVTRVGDVERGWPEAAEVERPAHWQAFLLRSESLEFLHGMSERLNRRLVVRRNAAGRWQAWHLQP